MNDRQILARSPLDFAFAAIGLFALASVLLADGPRTALACVAIAGALLLTRLRFALAVAAAVLMVLALAVVAVDGPRDDARPAAKQTERTHRG